LQSSAAAVAEITAAKIEAPTTSRLFELFFFIVTPSLEITHDNLDPRVFFEYPVVSMEQRPLKSTSLQRSAPNFSTLCRKRYPKNDTAIAKDIKDYADIT
jgi:hypothetical protein